MFIADAHCDALYRMVTGSSPRSTTPETLKQGLSLIHICDEGVHAQRRLHEHRADGVDVHVFKGVGQRLRQGAEGGEDGSLENEQRGGEHGGEKEQKLSLIHISRMEAIFLYISTRMTSLGTYSCGR